MYNNETQAQELLNDCFYKIFTKLELYNFQGAFEGWIRRLVVNTVTDHLRKKIKDDEIHKEVKPEDAYVNNDSIEQISHKELLKMIESIPDTQRKLLNINENNCRWHLNDARRRLKEKLNFIIK